MVADTPANCVCVFDDRDDITVQVIFFGEDPNVIQNRWLY